jgi:acrylyl-CoA reductase (NADPH)
MFKTLLLERGEAGFSAHLADIEEARLPGPEVADVLVRPEWSTLNYKDGLALTNKAPVVRVWPMVPGIDGAGEVLHSAHADWHPGDRFIHNGWGVGETHWGCLSQRARLKGDWLVRLPASMTTRQAMAIGTAGYTAMLCVMALDRHGLKPGDGEVLVTGATGGVGSIAIALMARAGHRVVAVSGKTNEADYLTTLGAVSVIDRKEFAAAGKPLQKERWAGVIDAVGSHTLANALAQTRYGGIVAACGLAQGMDLPASVAPFILRNVTLAGVESVIAPRALRQQAWDRLAAELDPTLLETMITEVPLAGAIDAAHKLMAGEVRGRIVVRID